MKADLINSIHKDVRYLGRRAVENGAELASRGGYIIDVLKDGKQVISLPTRRGRGRPGNIREIEAKLRDAGLLGTNKTSLQQAFDAAKKKRTQEDQRSEREPADVGVIDASKRSKATPVRGRYYSQAEFAARVRRRFTKAQKDGTVTSVEEFVEYAIVVAQQRAIDPPNFRGDRDPWDTDRIAKNVSNFVNGTSPGSRTLIFIETALDDLEGLLAPIPKTEPEVAAPEPLVPEPVVVLTTRSGRVVEKVGDGVKVFEDDVAAVPSDLRDQYTAILIARLSNDPNPPQELFDRIERMLGLMGEGD